MDVDIVDLRRTRDVGLLEQAYRELYLVCFTDPDEQEDLEQYRERLFGQQQDSPQPLTHFLVAGENLTDPDARVLRGMLIFELYRESGCGLLTYVAVAPQNRTKGLGRTLIARAVEILTEECSEGLQALFGETHDPALVEAAQDAMPPRDRIEVMKRYGGRLVPIRYVQPKLRENDNPSHKLLLLAFPTAPGHAPDVDGRVLVAFLDEFYRALGVADPSQNFDFVKMRDDVASSVRGSPPPAGEATARPGTDDGAIDQS